MKLLKNLAKTINIEFNNHILTQFEQYYEMLISWNKKINLTSITNKKEIQLIHFFDSLTIYNKDCFNPVNNLKIADVGSGAGFPGIPLKLAFPSINLTLIESVTKKTNFLEDLIDRLNLKNTTILNERIEHIATNTKYRETFDCVVSRGLAKLPILAELTLPLLKLGGYSLCYKKGDINEEIKQADYPIKLLGGKLEKPYLINLDIFQDSRKIIKINKESHSPEKYPRKPGIPQKRPLI